MGRLAALPPSLRDYGRLADPVPDVRARKGSKSSRSVARVILRGMGFTKQATRLAIAPERTFRVPLDLGHPEAAVIVRYAGPGNAAFRNAILKKPTIGGPESDTKNRLEREIDAPIFAETVIVGWDHIYEDGETEPCPFSVAKATELMLALAAITPADQFYKIVNNAQMIGNFRDAQVTADDLGKK